jgi:hypothetical protein
MADDVNEAVEQVLSGGLENASENEILRQLDAELEQQTQARAMVLGDDEPAAWVLGGESGGGIGSIASRFINFYADAIRREICDTEGGCLKEKYRSMIGDNVGDTVKAIAPVMLEAIGSKENSLGALPRVAAMLGLWLARSGLEQWCAKSPEQPAGGAAPAAPAAS